MKNLTDILDVIIGVVAFAVAAWQMVLFLTAKDERGFSDLSAGMTNLWIAIGATLVAIACLAIYYVRHPRTQEEIHITE